MGLHRTSEARGVCRARPPPGSLGGSRRRLCGGPPPSNAGDWMVLRGIFNSFFSAESGTGTRLFYSIMLVLREHRRTC